MRWPVYSLTKQTSRRFGHERLTGFTQFTLLVSVLTSVIVSPAFSQEPFKRLVRKFETRKLGIPNPTGLAFSPAANAFLVAPSPEATEMMIVSFAPDLQNTARIATAISDPLNMVFDSKFNRLLFFDARANELVEVKATDGEVADFSQERISRFDTRSLHLKNAQGLTLDPETGSLYFLSVPPPPASPRIVRVSPDPAGRLGASVTDVILSSLRRSRVRGIAFNPNDGHLYVMDPEAQKLYELTQEGEILTVRDLSSLGLGGAQNMVFAPSGDQTDAPDIMSLYIVNSSATSGRRSGDITELSLTRPYVLNLAAATIQPTLVQTILTSNWPSPDPSGGAYIPTLNRLFVSDGEVNEMAIFSGTNLWGSTLTGNPRQEFNTTSFSDEPTGVAFNPKNRHLFITDDTGPRSVYEVDPGPDGDYMTADDVVTSFKTSDYFSNDPEGITYDTVRGHLFVSDGGNSEVYQVNPGANGVFDGVAPAGDDIVSQFDTEALGVMDPEGVEFNTDNGNLYIVGDKTSVEAIVVETTRNGDLVNVFDLAFLNVKNPAGIAYAPSSVNPGQRNLYILDRGVDNGSDPNENDGKIFEISYGQSAPSPSLSIDNVRVTEGNGGTTQAVFTLSLSGQSGETVEVDYETGDGTATPGDDYAPAKGRASFTPGETSYKVTVEIVGDDLVEPDETFFVNLSNASHADIADSRGRGTIENDDSDSDPPASSPLLSIDNVRVKEGNEGMTQAVFTLSLSDASREAVEVNYATEDGSATHDRDYVPMKGRARFEPGETSYKVTVDVMGDESPERDETFFVNLSRAVNADIEDRRGRATIENDDSDNPPAPLPRIFIDDVKVREGNTGKVDAIFTLSLSVPSGETVKVSYETEGGSAKPESDYDPVKGEAVFQPGETSHKVTVAVLGDELVERDEVFMVHLRNAVNGEIEDDLGKGTIEDDDEGQHATRSKSFQDGVNDYNGTRDTELMLLLPNKNFGRDREMDIDGFPNRAALLSWDLTAIPPGSKIESVDITVNVTDASGQSYEFYRLLRPWIEEEATWREYAAGKRWRSGGANSSSDRDSKVLGVLKGNRGSVTISLNSEGVEAVQSWVDKPESNHGFIIMDYRRTWNSLAFSSRESHVVSHRPQLTVTYTNTNETDVASSSSSKPQGVEIPETISLRQAYPNPFNLETRIEYELPELSSVRLAVYNIRGQQVRMLVNEDQPAGLKSVTWNGRDDHDLEIGSGIYFVRLLVGQQSFVNRIVLQK